jgi:hypothetical protein
VNGKARMLVTGTFLVIWSSVAVLSLGPLFSTQPSYYILIHHEHVQMYGTVSKRACFSQTGKEKESSALLSLVRPGQRTTLYVNYNRIWFQGQTRTHNT